MCIHTYGKYLEGWPYKDIDRIWDHLYFFSLCFSAFLNFIMNTIPFIIKKLFQMVENFLLNHCTAKWEGQSTEPQMHPDIPLQLVTSS